MNVGDLIRYKHDKWQVGLVVELKTERYKPQYNNDILLVRWTKPRADTDRIQWCVRPCDVEVMKDGDWCDYETR